MAGRRVVLTGGASQLPGLRDLAALILDKQVRVGRPARIRGLAEATAGPAYATSAGLIAYAMTDDHDVEAPSLEEDFVKSPEPDGLVGRLGGWFRENF